MRECEHVTEQISALLDDMLDGGERAALDAHLAVCADCRALLADLTVLRDALAGELDDPPASLCGEIMASVGAETVGRRRGSRARWLRAGAMAAVLALTVTIGYYSTLSARRGGTGEALVAPFAASSALSGGDLDSYQYSMAEPEKAAAPSAPPSAAQEENGILRIEDSGVSNAAPPAQTADIAGTVGTGAADGQERTGYLAVLTLAPPMDDDAEAGETTELEIPAGELQRVIAYLEENGKAYSLEWGDANGAVVLLRNVRVSDAGAYFAEKNT